MKTEEDLLRLKKIIQNTREEKNKIEGTIEHLSSELQETYSCKTTTEAEERLEKINETIEKLEESLSDIITLIEEAYPLF